MESQASELVEKMTDQKPIEEISLIKTVYDSGETCPSIINNDYSACLPNIFVCNQYFYHSYMIGRLLPSAIPPDEFLVAVDYDATISDTVQIKSQDVDDYDVCYHGT